MANEIQTSGALRRSAFLGGAAAAGSAAFVGFPNIARAQATTVRVGTLNILSDAPFLVAERKGFWKDEGLSIDFSVFHSAGDMVVPMSQDALDSGGGTIAAGLYNGAARGLTARAVASKGSDAPKYGTDCLLVRNDLIKSGKYKTPKDLKGMTVACNEAGSGSSAALYFLLQKYGLGFDDIKRAYLAFPDHVAALENGKVDAAYTAEPFITIAKKSGQVTSVMGDDEWYPYQQLSVVLFSGDFMTKRPELAKKFMRGYIRAVRFYHGALANGKYQGQNAAEVIQILNDVTKPKDPNLYKETTAFYVGPDARLEMKSVQRDLDYFRGQKLIANPASRPADVIDTTWLEAALKELGTYKGPRA